MTELRRFCIPEWIKPDIIWVEYEVITNQDIFTLVMIAEVQIKQGVN